MCSSKTVMKHFLSGFSTALGHTVHRLVHEPISRAPISLSPINSKNEREKNSWRQSKQLLLQVLE